VIAALLEQRTIEVTAQIRLGEKDTGGRASVKSTRRRTEPCFGFCWVALRNAGLVPGGNGSESREPGISPQEWVELRQTGFNTSV
jgi:hypothetical protein